MTSTPVSGQPQGLCSLPYELLYEIVRYLPPDALSSLAQTCSLLSQLTRDDAIWQAFVTNLRLSSPAPYSSFRDLYLALRPHLYLAPHLWFSERAEGGSLYVFRYSSRSGNIEGVPLIGIHNSVWTGIGLGGLFDGTDYIWDDDQNIRIATFKKPVVRSFSDDVRTKIVCGPASYYDRQRGLMLNRSNGKIWRSASNGVVSLGRLKLDQYEMQNEARDRRHDSPVSEDDDDTGDYDMLRRIRSREGIPGEPSHDRLIWPPSMIPSRERVHLPLMQMKEGIIDIDAYETTPEILPHAFPCHSSSLPGRDSASSFLEPPSTKLDDIFASDHIYVYRAPSGSGLDGVESSLSPTFRAVDLFSKVDPSLYTQQPRPSNSTSDLDILDLNGIWLGDYFTHGPEFLFFHHPNKHNRRLEIIKLTGDSNVPRGEYTFMVPNLDIEGSHNAQRDNDDVPSSFLRFAHPGSDPKAWTGKPVYKGKGQIANGGFRTRTWVEIELVVLDPGRVPHQNRGELAIVWKPLHHATRVWRLDMDKILFGFESETANENKTGCGEDGDGAIYLHR